MEVSLYLVDYTTENIKNENFYKLFFADNINYVMFNIYLTPKELKRIINKIDNADPSTLENLKKEVLK